MNQKPSQSGNVLFLILIAVVLFAALSFAVTMSGRGQTGENVGKDSRGIALSQLTQNSVDLERAIIRMRIAKRIPATSINFDHPALTGYANPNCLDSECAVFNPQGGQISYAPPSKTWLDPANSGDATYGTWIFTGTACVPGVGLGTDASCNTNSDNFEITAYLPWMSRAMCIDINKKQGIPLDAGGPPKAAGSLWSATPAFTGTFSTGEVVIDTNNVLFGKMEGCVEGTGTPPAGTYHYFRVIFPR